MDKVKNKTELLRRYTVFSFALYFIAVGVSLITLSLAGTSPISSIPYVLSLNTILSMGTFILLLNVALIAGQMLMLGREGIARCKMELILQLPVSVVFGVFVDLNMNMLSVLHPDSYWQQMVTLAIGCLFMATGISLEVIADVAMVSGEYFVHIAAQRFRREFGTIKIMFDLSLVVIAVICSWIMAGRIDGVREGTLITAMLTGPLVRLIMPHLKTIERWETGKSQPAAHTAATASSTLGTVITIAREYGSGGHDIGRLIANTIGIPFYDNSMMEMVARESGHDEQTVRQYDQRLPHGLLYEMITQDYSTPVDRSLSTQDMLFVAQSRVIRHLASQGPCVIVGRCSDYVLRDHPDCINIYLHAPMDYKVERAISHYSVPADKATEAVARTNSARASHYAYYTGKRWDDARNYHAVFDTSKNSARQICDAVVAMYNNHVYGAGITSQQSAPSNKIEAKYV